MAALGFGIGMVDSSMMPELGNFLRLGLTLHHAALCLAGSCWANENPLSGSTVSISASADAGLGKNSHIFHPNRIPTKMILKQDLNEDDESDGHHAA